MSFKSMNCSRFFGYGSFVITKAFRRRLRDRGWLTISLPVVFNGSGERNYRSYRQREGRAKDTKTTRNATTVVIFVRPRLTSGDPGAPRPRRRVASLFDMVLCDEKFYCKSFSKILIGRCWVPVDLWRDRPKELHTHTYIHIHNLKIDLHVQVW